MTDQGLKYVPNPTVLLGATSSLIAQNSTWQQRILTSVSNRKLVWSEYLQGCCLCPRSASLSLISDLHKLIPQIHVDKELIAYQNLWFINSVSKLWNFLSYFLVFLSFNFPKIVYVNKYKINEEIVIFIDLVVLCFFFFFFLVRMWQQHFEKGNCYLLNGSKRLRPANIVAIIFLGRDPFQPY